MPAPENRFKTAIHAGRPQIGLWLENNPNLPLACGDALHAQLVSNGYNGPYLFEGGTDGPCP